jgi:hypothetical protein
MPFPRPNAGPTLADLAPALAVTAMGLGLLALAYTQPAWLGARVGPGLFAQWSAKGVTLLGLAMAGLAALGWPVAGPPPARVSVAGPPPARSSLAAGLVILGGAALFAAFARDIGLVAACALAAAATGWAAGERDRAAVLRSATIGAVAAVAIGYTLLPEAAPIWP